MKEQEKAEREEFKETIEKLGFKETIEKLGSNEFLDRLIGYCKKDGFLELREVSFIMSILDSFRFILTDCFINPDQNKDLCEIFDKNKELSQDCLRLIYAKAVKDNEKKRAMN